MLKDWHLNIPINILARAFRLIFAQPLQTLRVIRPSLVAGLAAILLAVVAIAVIDGAEDRNASTIGLPLLVLLVTVPLVIYAAIAFAVYWHRHALLLGDARDEMMKAPKGTFSRYVMDAATNFLIALAAALPVGFVVGFMAALTDNSASPDSWFLVGLNAVMAMFLSWIVLRVSLILPATSVGQKFTIEKSWAATRTMSKDIFWTAVLLGVLNAVGMTLAAGLVELAPFLGLLAQLSHLLFQSLLYVSVLSTLYGHLVQGRPLT